jgi:hypothetical protein
VWQEVAAEDAQDVPYFDLTAYLQPGYIIRHDDEDVAAMTTIPASDDHFWLRRARVGFRTLIHPWLFARLELEAAPSPVLTDAYVDVLAIPELQIRVGQYKVPFLRSAGFSESSTGFLDPPLYLPTARDRGFLRYLQPRDVGIMLHGIVGDVDFGPAVSYGAGVFLGNGANPTSNPDASLMVTARVEGDLFGVPIGAGVENDLARNDRPRIGLGAGVLSTCDDAGDFERGFTVDAELRYEGIYASAAFVRFRNGPASDDVWTSLMGYDQEEACGGESAMFLPDHLAWGAHVQAQYVLPQLLFPVDGQSLELLARWDIAQPHEPNDGFLGGDDTSPGYVAPTSYAADAEQPPNQWRLTFGLNWYPTDETRLRLGLSYQHRRETEDVLPLGPTGPRIGDLSNDILWLQLTAGI